MAVEIWQPIIIDRISMLVTIGSDDLYSFIYAQLKAMEEESKVLLPYGKIVVRFNKSNYTTRLDYYPKYANGEGGKRKIVDITLGKNKIKGLESLYMHLTLTLYPSKFEANEFERLKEILAMLFDIYDYSTFYNYGQVNYLELAWDCRSHANHTFLPFQKSISKSYIYTEKDGCRGTVYIGSSESDRYMRIYDKRKKNVKDGVEAKSGLPRTRFESVRRRLHLAAPELANIENPFLSLKVADLGKAKALQVDFEWPAFLADCESMGVPRALPTVKSNQSRRKKYTAALNSVPASWWKPHNAWKHFPTALLKIAP